jgi:hypothetical protein
MEPYDSSWINKKATHQGVAFCFSKGIGLQVQMKKTLYGIYCLGSLFWPIVEVKLGALCPMQLLVLIEQGGKKAFGIVA